MRADTLAREARRFVVEVGFARRFPVDNASLREMSNYVHKPGQNEGRVRGTEVS